MATYDHAAQLFRQGRIQQAEAELERYVQRDPDDAQAMFLLGVCHFREGKPAAAERSFRRAIFLNAGHYNALYYLGLTLESQGLDDEAQQCFANALIVKPDFQAARRKYRGQPPTVARDPRPRGAPRPRARTPEVDEQALRPSPVHQPKPMARGAATPQAREKVGCLRSLLTAVLWVPFMAIGGFVGAAVAVATAGSGTEPFGILAGLVVFQILWILMMGRKRKRR
jgi:tetratricopeptide (TPR) repeat protein